MQCDDLIYMGVPSVMNNNKNGRIMPYFQQHLHIHQSPTPPPNPEGVARKSKATCSRPLSHLKGGVLGF